MNPYLIADIGGTNARFAIMNNTDISHYKAFSCAEFESFEHVLDAYLSTLEIKPTHAVIAIATNVSSDLIEMTNLPWSFSIAELGSKIGFEEFKVLNDFAAIAISIPLLNKQQTTQISGPENSIIATKAIIGAGTGLGMSGLVPYDDAWIPLQGEGGHISLSAVTTFEHTVIEQLSISQGHVTAESVLSGQGLVNLYGAISEIHKSPKENLTPAEIVSKAIEDNDELCEKVLDTFCGFFGGACGDLALILGAEGGVYIGGGIVNHLGKYFINNEKFKNHFLNKGNKQSYLSSIPIHVITDTRIGIQGAFEASKNNYKDIGITWLKEPDL